MRNLIKKFLKEEVQKYDTIQMIRDYKGTNKYMLSFQDQLKQGRTLSQRQIDTAIDVLKTKYYRDSLIYDALKNKEVEKEIKRLGIGAYLNLVKTKKSEFLKPSPNFKIIVDKPSQDWVDRNNEDLKFFIDNTKNSPTTHQFPDRIHKVSTHQEARSLIFELKTDKFKGFVEVDGDKKEWSILNKIDTNTLNWAKMITKRYLNADLGIGSAEQILNRYFEQKPVYDFYPEFEELDKHKQHIVIDAAKTLSFAEFDIIEAFHHQNDEESEMLAIDPLSNIIGRIQKTTGKGDLSEKKFIEWLLTSKNVPQSDIHNFSSWGNLVDITFQTDLILTLNGTKIPIQVKSKETYSKLLTYDIGGIVVFPADSVPKREKYGNWLYTSKGKIGRAHV